MSIRDTIKWGGVAGINAETVTAVKLRAMKRALGGNRLLAATTPGVSYNAATDGGFLLSYPQSNALRIFLTFKRVVLGSLTGIVTVKVWPYSGTGGKAPEDWITTHPPDVLMANYTLRHNWDALDAGDRHTWLQLAIGSRLWNMFAGSSFTDSPICYSQKNKLWLEIIPSNCEYLKNIMVYDWPTHPSYSLTSSFPGASWGYYDGGEGGQRVVTHSFGARSTFDIFWGG